MQNISYKEMVYKFKQEHSLQERLQQSQELLKIYPNLICAIFEKGDESVKAKQNNIGQLSKSKYMLQKSLTHQYIYQYMKNQLKLNPEQSLYIMVNNSILKQDGCMIEDTYNKYKDLDGFLYFTFVGQIDKG